MEPGFGYGASGPEEVTANLRSPIEAGKTTLTARIPPKLGGSTPAQDGEPIDYLAEIRDAGLRKALLESLELDAVKTPLVRKLAQAFLAAHPGLGATPPAAPPAVVTHAGVAPPRSLPPVASPPAIEEVLVAALYRAIDFTKIQGQGWKWTWADAPGKTSEEKWTEVGVFASDQVRDHVRDKIADHIGRRIEPALARQTMKAIAGKTVELAVRSAWKGMLEIGAGMVLAPEVVAIVFFAIGVAELLDSLDASKPTESLVDDVRAWLQQTEDAAAREARLARPFLPTLEPLVPDALYVKP